jgi:ceramide glucosyltransferase
MFSLRALFAGAALAGTVAGTAYSIFAILRMRAFERSAAVQPTFLPPITVLKPLHGEEPHLYENLRSFCEQEYPAFQILFCSADASDPALEHARRLQHEFPQLDIEIAAGKPQPARNPKIGNLLGASGRVKHQLLVIADSDIRVPSHYLRALAACFEDPQTGAATCLYAGEPADSGLPSQLGAMYVNDHFAPSVLVALALEPLTYCFGATMAVRADVLRRIGGLQALADHLGDDYRLGNFVRDAGYRVALCPQLVRTTVHERNWRAMIAHEVRWARTVRMQRTAGYAGALVTHPLALAALYAALTGFDRAGVAVFAGVCAVRVLLDLQARKSFALSGTVTPPLVPLRDVLAFGVWCAGLSGRRIAWRAQSFEAAADGRLVGSPEEV